jgi:hypothetical protein
MPDEPKLGKVEFFPDLTQCADAHRKDALHPPRCGEASLQAASVTANDLLAAIQRTPPGAIGSFIPDTAAAAMRLAEESALALKRERNYQLLQAAAILRVDCECVVAVERAVQLLAEIERRNP